MRHSPAPSATSSASLPMRSGGGVPSTYARSRGASQNGYRRKNHASRPDDRRPPAPIASRVSTIHLTDDGHASRIPSWQAFRPLHPGNAARCSGPAPPSASSARWPEAARHSTIFAGVAAAEAQGAAAGTQDMTLPAGTYARIRHDGHISKIRASLRRDFRGLAPGAWGVSRLAMAQFPRILWAGFRDPRPGSVRSDLGGLQAQGRGLKSAMARAKTRAMSTIFTDPTTLTRDRARRRQQPLRRASTRMA